MNKAINKVRYTYYYDHKFYNLLGSAIGLIISIIYFSIVRFDYQNFTLDLIYNILIIGITAFFLGMPLIKCVLAVEFKYLVKAVSFAAISAILSFIGIWLEILKDNNIGLQILGVGLIGLDVMSMIYLRINSGTIKIFPNRVQIGKNTIYYKDIQEVKWNLHSIDNNLSEAQKKKEMKILTPIAFEFGGRDFTLFHYHVLIEMADKLYIAQPLFYRNSFVQNIKNGWVEDWRWDGTSVPPDNWDIAEKKYITK
jgi:hypothetical protein